VRGLGIVAMRHRPKAPVSLVVDLVKPVAVERLPPARPCRLATVTLPLLRVAPFEASAAAKILLAVRPGGKGVVSAP
jgi:HPr kinase/phosphorylase